VNTPRNIAWPIIAAFAIVSACGAPAYVRGAHIPADAKLENWPKIGWGWELCLDQAGGSAYFTWDAEDSSGPFIRVREATCAAGGDPRDILRVEGSAQLDFLFPEAPGNGAEFADGACPHRVSPEALARFGNTLEAAIESGRLTPEAAGEAAHMRAAIAQVDPERLALVGSMGNANGWSLRCRPEAST